jgi:hypothetical protein
MSGLFVLFMFGSRADWLSTRLRNARRGDRHNPWQADQHESRRRLRAQVRGGTGEAALCTPVMACHLQGASPCRSWPQLCS